MCNEIKNWISLHFRLPPQFGFESKQKQIQLAHGCRKGSEILTEARTMCQNELGRFLKMENKIYDV